MGKIRSWAFAGSLSIFFFTSALVRGQATQVVQAHDKITIRSKILNEEREILVRVPADYKDGSGRYPVVYMLDGRAPLINLMTGTIEHLAWSDLMPEMILVSIPNTIRARDMTPMPMDGRPETGGAEIFLKFIETELIPTIESEYRVHPYRIIAGHSMSGLFVTYAFASRPDLFNAYLAASPALTPPWDNGFVQSLARETLKKRKQLNRTLFYIVGDEPNFTGGFMAFKHMLDSFAVSGLDYSLQQVPEENHASTIALVFRNGLRKIWKGMNISLSVFTGDFSLADIEDHYKSVSIKYGYTINASHEVLYRAGYALLQKKQVGEAVRVFKRAVDLYPASPIIHNSYAEALEQNGQLAEAKENLEKALKLSDQVNNVRVAQISREQLKRVNAKLAEKTQQ